MTVVIFLIVLAVLIFVHELGHFLAAKSFNIRVDAFKLGFGPKLFSWKKDDTEYGLNAIPFGGYVKIFGEDPNEENTHGPDAAKSFVNKSRLKQAIVLVAGVLFNFIFAWMIYSIVFASGVTAAADSFGQYADHFSDQRIMITYIVPNSPADKAGLKEGDVVTGVGGATPVTATPASRSIEDIQNSINASKGSPITINYTSGTISKSVEVTPVHGLVSDKYAIGISMDNVVDLRLPFFPSVREGLRYTGVMIRETAIGLYTFVVNIFQGTANFGDVAGPVGIAGIVGNAAALGFTYLLMITALISVNLGVINLIPFPALDGGRVLFVLFEGIFRRRIPARFTNVVNTVGFVLLMVLMVAVTWKDVAKLIG